MYIFSVMRYGNEEDGPDGDDTEYIVLASSVEQAGELVDNELKKCSCQKVSNFCHAVVSIGESFSDAKAPIIICGPLVTHNSLLDYGVSEGNVWRRKMDMENGGWVPLAEY